MYKFIIQKQDRIQFDFIMETLNAIDFTNWYNNETIYSYERVGTIRDEHLSKGNIPIGTVEFVQEYYRKLGIEESKLKPINIPEELIKYADRKVWYGDETTQITKNTFCKSADKLKGFTDIVYPGCNLEPGKYIFSELIEIESEWRCFVLNGELLGVHNYSNSLGDSPDIGKIKQMISEFGKLKAYTLDVGVNETGTFPIEVHDFYSCGLYGFRDYTKLLQMTILSHRYKM